MNTYIRCLLLACGLPLAFVGCATTQGRQTEWEYKILRVAPEKSVSDTEKALNELARQGWVLVSESTTLVDKYVDTFVLKRVVPNQ